MSVQLLGLNEIQGSLVALDHVPNVSNEEMVEIELPTAQKCRQSCQIEGEKAVVQVFQGTDGLSKTNTKQSS
jgi:V/A-type H+-transporting ATPase subunit B